MFVQLEYPKAKHLNLSEFELDENEHFNYIPVNLARSTVHVPTNVFDECKSKLLTYNSLLCKSKMTYTQLLCK